MITSRLRPDTASGLPPSPAPPPRPPRAATAAGRKPGPAGPQGHPHPVPAAGPGATQIWLSATQGPQSPEVAEALERGEIPEAFGRTWVLEIPARTVLLTSNHRLHRMRANEITRSLKAVAAGKAREQKIPRIERADIWFTYVPPPKLKRDRDPLASACVNDGAGLAPTGKALIDGISGTRHIENGIHAAGVFIDDNRKHVRWEAYRLLDGTDPCGQLRMYICEVPA